MTVSGSGSLRRALSQVPAVDRSSRADHPPPISRWTHSRCDLIQADFTEGERFEAILLARSITSRFDLVISICPNMSWTPEILDTNRGHLPVRAGAGYGLKSAQLRVADFLITVFIW